MRAPRLILALGFLALLAPAPGLLAKDHPAPPKPLDHEHQHPSGAFTFRTPEGWKVEPLASDPMTVQASGDGVIVRFLYRKGDVGYDTLHVDCMMLRLTGPFEMQPQVRYEYDFLSRTVGEMRLLDSAFITIYDAPIAGEVEWRQRNLTITGEGHSLCAISYVPYKLWKKSKPTQELVENVVRSVAFPQPAKPAGAQ
jgi:hypothetical protein